MGSSLWSIRQRKSHSVRKFPNLTRDQLGRFLFNTACLFWFLIRCKPDRGQVVLYIQEKWVTEATNHKLVNELPYPKFPQFVALLEKISRMKNDRSLEFNNSLDPNKVEQQKMYQAKLQSRMHNSTVSAFKTQVQTSGIFQKSRVSTRDGCPMHENSKHALNECRSLRARPIDEGKHSSRKTTTVFAVVG